MALAIGVGAAAERNRGGRRWRRGGSTNVVLSDGVEAAARAIAAVPATKEKWSGGWRTGGRGYTDMVVA